MYLGDSMKKINSILFGLLIVALGVIFLGNSLDIWDIDVFFKGWWTLFILIPSIFGLFNKDFISSLIGIIVSILLLLVCNDYMNWHMFSEILISSILIIIGISFIFKPKIKKISRSGESEEYIGIFSSNEVSIDDTFKGAKVVAVFGGVDLDLRDAKIEEDIVIDCVTIFGGIDIRLPKNVKVKTNGVPIFGGIEDNSKKGDGPTVVINYVCIFAGIDLK